MSSIALISFSTRTIYGTWFQQLLCHSTTLMINTVCPISTLNEQLTNLEQFHVQCSLHCERRTVKGKDCASVFILSIILLTGRTSERNSWYGWRVEWSLEAQSKGWSSTVCDELYLYLSVAVCFSCFFSFVCWCNICCFFERLLFCFFSLVTLSEK